MKYSHWVQAMNEEIQALKNQGTWNFVPPAPNQRLIDNKWVYKIKEIHLERLFDIRPVWLRKDLINNRALIFFIHSVRSLK